MTARAAAGVAIRPTQGRPVAPTRSRLRPVPIGDVRINSGFWADAQERNARASILHAAAWMERVGWIGNFDAAVDGRLPQDRRGREFSDSEIYKLLEAMAWETGRTGDTELDEHFRVLAARVAAVQEPDGYLNTMHGRPGQPPRYSDLEWGHELYCAGHLIQAAVARSRTAGPDPLMDVARNLADHICREFGRDQRRGVCGHPEIEMALVELFRETGEVRYLDQAALFIERRGTGALAEIAFGPSYFQDDMPVRQAEVLRGHAVRALYLTSGAIDVAVETDDTELLRATQSQVARTMARRTYINGGMGAHHEGESFGEDYQLPPDRAYAETCAGVAAVQASHRLLLATGDMSYADLAERILYNVISTSVAPDGRGFFYTNTLQVRTRPQMPAPDRQAARAASGLRAPWFAVSCCPTNVARTLASLEGYVATVDEEGLQLHHFVDGTISTQLADGSTVALSMSTAYPEDGVVTVRIEEGPSRPWTLSLRVPSWAHGAGLRHTGDSGGAWEEVPAGKAAVTTTWRPGDRIELKLPVRARWIYPHPRIDAVRGQVAVERGPLVYCMEEADLGDDVAGSRVDVRKDPVDVNGEVTVLVEDVDPGQADGWPYGEAATRSDFGRGVAAGQLRPVRLERYHRWGTREPGTMRVWLPVANGE